MGAREADGLAVGAASKRNILGVNEMELRPRRVFDRNLFQVCFDALPNLSTEPDFALVDRPNAEQFHPDTDFLQARIFAFA